MVWYSISREDRYIELFYFPVPGKKEPCLQGEAEKMVSKLFGNYSREQPFFLQLKDYFWVKTPSLYELPYGTKGSEDLLLRVLAITSYSIPESIQRLNSAPVAGYEQDVGSKTTMRLFYPESAHFNPKVEDNPDTLLVLVAFKAMDFHWIESILSDKKRVRKGFWKQPPLIWDVNPKQIRILNPFYMEIAADKLLSLPIHQPHKIKQVMRGCGRMGRPEGWGPGALWDVPGEGLSLLSTLGVSATKEGVRELRGVCRPRRGGDRGNTGVCVASLSVCVWGGGCPPCSPPPYQAHPQALTMRSGGGVLRMKHLIWPFSPCRACCVWVLEMMGGPVGETASYQRIGRGGPPAGPL
ncbi:CMP-N-acetylneuraminate-beta-galactosamide-alpha-2, 3-sialyltransferase 4, partial [Bos mutus]